MPIPDGSALFHTAKEPGSLAAGSVPVGFVLIDELVKHAVLSWIVESLKGLFGSAGVLTFIGGHPFAAYSLLVALWVVFVYWRASRRGAHGPAFEPQQSASAPTASASGSARATAIGEIKQGENSKLHIGNEIHNVQHQLPVVIPPRVMFGKWEMHPDIGNAIPVGQTGCYLIASGADAHKVKIYPFEIGPSIYAEGNEIEFIVPGSNELSLVWICGTGIIKDFDILGAMSRGNPGPIPGARRDHEAHVKAIYADAKKENWYETAADLQYHTSLHRLVFVNHTFRECGSFRPQRPMIQFSMDPAVRSPKPTDPILKVCGIGHVIGLCSRVYG